MPDDLPTLLFAAAADFEAWLGEHHAESDGTWLKIAKKGAPEPSVTYPEAVELALCFGWIDGQRRAFDETHFLQRFTPRRPRGRWSKINREKAEALIDLGRMRPAGMAEIEVAEADGRWEAAYEGQRNAKVPADLQRELDASPAAAKFFAGADPLRTQLSPVCGDNCVRTLGAWTASCCRRPSPRPVSRATAPIRCGSGWRAGCARTRR